MAKTPILNRELADLQATGFQNFVDQSALISPVTAIINRAQIPDISKDLRVSFGVERIAIQQVYEIQNEFGASGERVFGAVNDDRGLIRFVGTDWASSALSSQNGAFALANAVGSYVEITFYGTGLNILGLANNSTRDWRATVDGGTEGSNFYLATSGVSSVQYTRNYAPNNVMPVVSGLSIGVHTVKIRLAADNMGVFGFEILNTSSTSSLSINKGTAYLSGNRIDLSTATSSSYNSGFTNVYGTAGSVGGRVLTYLASDGTIKKDVQYVNTAQANLTSADHTNEEVIRTYYWREFGANRTDDFSTVVPSPGLSRAFTLDDGTTTLISTANVYSGFNSTESFYVNGANTYTTLSFVGTGLDILMNNDGSSRPGSIQIDGGSTIAYDPSGTTGTKILKIVSGLPYGTHTVRFNNTGGSSYGIFNFKVYGPKKPALPSGSLELCDYFIPATYVANSVAGSLTIGKGVLRKINTRELNFNGTWAVVSPVDPDELSGFQVFTTTSASYVEYTFVGSGIDFRFLAGSGVVQNLTFLIDGSSNFTAANSSPTFGAGWSSAINTTTSYYGPSGVTLSSFNPATLSGTYGATNYGAGVSISGLTYGVHRIRVTTNNTGAFKPAAFDIITPIHSPKSNLYSDLQNTLPVGSCSLSDNRATTPVKYNVYAPKAWAQAVGVASSPATSSTVPVPVPDLSLTIKTQGGPIEVGYSLPVTNSAITNGVQTQVYVDGIAVGTIKMFNNSVATYMQMLSDSMIVPVGAGIHKVDLYWYTDAGTATTRITYRTLKAREF